MDYQKQIEEILRLNDGTNNYCGLVELPIGLIDEEDKQSLLRDAQRESDEYVGLVQSIKATNGPMSPIAVRPGVTDHNKFVIIDGVQRYNACKDNNISTIKVNLFPNINDRTQIMALQIQGNVHKVKTRPAQYGMQLKRMLGLNPHMTMTELADLAKCTPGWVSSMLKMANGLDESIMPLVDNGSIVVNKALKLADLPKEEQLDWVDRAKDEPLEDFLSDIMTRLSEIKRERQGLPKEEWQPKAKLRTLKEMTDLLVQLTDEYGEIDYNKVDTTSASYRAGFLNQLKYAINLDEESINEQRTQRDERESERQRKKQEALSLKAATTKAVTKESAGIR